MGLFYISFITKRFNFATQRMQLQLYCFRLTKYAVIDYNKNYYIPIEFCM